MTFLLLLSVPFYVGETFTYSVKWTFISAGTMTLGITDVTEVSGVNAYHTVMTAHGGLGSYRINDTIEAWFDTSNVASVKYSKRLHEGNYRANKTILYDQSARSATYPDGAKLSIPPGAVDPLTLFYYLRTLDLAVGQEVSVPYHVDGRSENVTVYVERAERVKVPYGTFDCLRLRARLKTGKNIFGQKGDVTVWLTNNAEHLPVRVSTRMVFGSMNASLKSKR